MELRKTQSDLGAMIGLNHSRIAKIEAGIFPNNPRLIVSIAQALDCSLDWLFGMPNAPKPCEIAPNPYNGDC